MEGMAALQLADMEQTRGGREGTYGNEKAKAAEKLGPYVNGFL